MNGETDRPGEHIRTSDDDLAFIEQQVFIGEFVAGAMNRPLSFEQLICTILTSIWTF